MTGIATVKEITLMTGKFGNWYVLTLEGDGNSYNTKEDLSKGMEIEYSVTEKKAGYKWLTDVKIISGSNEPLIIKDKPLQADILTAMKMIYGSDAFIEGDRDFDEAYRSCEEQLWSLM